MSELTQKYLNLPRFLAYEYYIYISHTNKVRWHIKELVISKQKTLINIRNAILGNIEGHGRRNVPTT